MKEKNSIIEIIPIEQTGHICKPTTIATIDLYYATQHDFPPIPLNKKNNPLHQGVIKNLFVVNRNQTPRDHRRNQSEEKIPRQNFGITKENHREFF